MSIAEKTIRTTIMPWKAMGMLSVIVAGLCGLQSCVADEIEEDRIEELNSTVIAQNVVCQVKSFDEHGKMRLSCGNRGQHEIRNVWLALAHASNHRPLTCTLYRVNPPSCESNKTK